MVYLTLTLFGLVSPQSLTIVCSFSVVPVPWLIILMPPRHNITGLNQVVHHAYSQHLLLWSLFLLCLSMNISRTLCPWIVSCFPFCLSFALMVFVSAIITMFFLLVYNYNVFTMSSHVGSVMFIAGFNIFHNRVGMLLLYCQFVYVNMPLCPSNMSCCFMSLFRPSQPFRVSLLSIFVILV